MGRWSVVGCGLALCVVVGNAVASGVSVHSSAQTRDIPTVLRELAGPVDSQPYWYVQGSVWTKHFSPDPEHNNNQNLIGLERHRDDSYLWGAATFRHSFGGRSHYGYVGKRFDFAGTPFNAKLTAGLLHGYRGEYRDKIPFNRFGIAPAVIPSLGASYRRVGVDVVLLGTAATMVNVGFKL